MSEVKWISYLRVSTDRQGKSGLGIEAQRNSVTDFLNGGQWGLVKEYTEVESGKRTDRPMLAEAIKTCRAMAPSLSLPSWTGCRVMRISCSVWKRPALILSLPICRTPTA
jgi:hypothetical protein